MRTRTRREDCKTRISESNLRAAGDYSLLIRLSTRKLIVKGIKKGGRDASTQVLARETRDCLFPSLEDTIKWCLSRTLKLGEAASKDRITNSFLTRHCAQCGTVESEGV